MERVITPGNLNITQKSESVIYAVMFCASMETTERENTRMLNIMGE